MLPYCVSGSARIAREPGASAEGICLRSYFVRVRGLCRLPTAWGPDKFLSSQSLLQYILMDETVPEGRDDREVARWEAEVVTATVYNSCLSRQQ